MAIDLVKLGDRVRQCRMDRDLTQEALAEKLGTNGKHISNIELGEKSPSIKMLVKIANTLQVSLDVLLYDSLDHANAAEEEEIRKIIMTCNAAEKKALTRMLVFMKELFSEYGI